MWSPKRSMVPGSRNQGIDMMDYSECCVCFGPMYAEPVAVLQTLQGRRACGHILHHRCATSWIQTAANCPMCRAPCARCTELPNFETHPREFLQALDADGSGTLDETEVRLALSAVLPVEGAWLEVELPKKFREWDTNGDGAIDYGEATAVLEFVRANAPTRALRAAEIPSIHNTPREWFKFWDEDKSGELSKNEVTRALIRTFRLKFSLEQTIAVHGILDGLWPIFDPDGSGEIDEDEFQRPDGLCETVLANMPLN